jgi:hypothetical protein
MGRFKATIGAACATALLTAGVAGAQGIVPDRTTYVTISAPVSVPGTVLPAGTYTFRLADTLASRNVVQIFDKDGSKVYATLITVAAERNEPSGDAVITFRETPADQPPALHFWYYAGEKAGHEFVYPKEQATQIAQRSGESVLAVDTASNDLENMKTGEISRVEGAAAAATQPSESTAADSTAAREPAAPESTTATRQADETAPRASAQETTPAPAPAPAPMPQSETAAAEARTPATQPGESARATGDTMPRPTGTSGASAPRELPRTASGMPLVGLVGFLALGAAFGVRALRRRVLV